MLAESGEFYIHIGLPELLPRRLKTDAPEKKKKEYYKREREATFQWIEELQPLLVVPERLKCQNTQFTLVAVMCYKGVNVTDTDNVNISTIKNVLVQYLRLAPDDSPVFIRDMVLGMADYIPYVEPFFIEHEFEELKNADHTEIYFLRSEDLKRIFT